jgi:hypothetical protein
LRDAYRIPTEKDPAQNWEIVLLLPGAYNGTTRFH